MPVDIEAAITARNPQDVQTWIAEIQRSSVLTNVAFYGPQKNQTLLELAILAVENSPKPAIEAVQVINILLENGANANAVSSHILQFPLLTFAVANIKDQDACIAVCNSLLNQEGVEIDKKERNGNTALAIACYFGKFQVAELLMERGASPTSKNLHKESIFYAACGAEKPDVEFVRRLFLDPRVIEAGDVMSKCSQGFTPLLSASTAGDLGVIDFLVQNGADIGAVTNNGLGVLHCNFVTMTNLTVPIVKTGGNLEVVKYFVNLGVDRQLKTTVGGLTPFVLACRTGNIDSAKYLYSIEPQQYHKTDSIIQFLSEISYNLEILKFLAEEREADLLAKISGYSILNFALLHPKRNPESFEYLLDLYSANLTKLHSEGKLPPEKTPEQIFAEELNQLLFEEVKSSRGPEMTEILISRGAANFVDKGAKQSTLHYACKNKKNEVVRHLLQNRCDPNQRDICGFTPMYIANQSDNQVAVELLLEAGVKPFDREAEDIIIAQDGVQHLAQVTPITLGAELQLTPAYIAAKIFTALWDLPPPAIPLSQHPIDFSHYNPRHPDISAMQTVVAAFSSRRRPAAESSGAPPATQPRVEGASPFGGDSRGGGRGNSSS